jgi:hypothetical protein
MNIAIKEPVDKAARFHHPHVARTEHNHSIQSVYILHPCYTPCLVELECVIQVISDHMSTPQL